MKKRLIGLVTAAAITSGVGFALASPASAHEVPPIEDPSPTSVAANVGNGTDYLLNHVQHTHVEAPLLGLGPATVDPVGYTGGHVLPFTIDVAERLAGVPSDDEGADGGHGH
jgi:hypothetical protein